MELSNSKHDKAIKLLENTSANMMSRHALKNESNDVEFVGFKIKWRQKKKDKDGVECVEEEEILEQEWTLLTQLSPTS